MVDSSAAEKPRRLLLATDLSARCDRALDRAAMLAREWDAALTVVHAFEPDVYAMVHDPRPTPSWRQDPNLRSTIAAKQLHADLDQLDVPFDMVVQEGKPADIVLSTARELDASLVVTGIARGETFGRFIFGGTVEKLVRRSTMPVLVVKSRARHPYRSIVVATDFSAASRNAIVATRRMFSDARVTLLHCYESTPASVMSAAAPDDAGRQRAMEEYAAFVSGDPDAARHVTGLPIMFERGSVDSMIQAYATDRPLDLLVIGSQGRNPVTRALFGSTAELMMASAPSDVLVVPPAG